MWRSQRQTTCNYVCSTAHLNWVVKCEKTPLHAETNDKSMDPFVALGRAATGCLGVLVLAMLAVLAVLVLSYNAG